MKSDEPLRVKSTELPKVLELIGPKGEIIPYMLVPKKKTIGVALNGVQTPLRKLIYKIK